MPQVRDSRFNALQLIRAKNGFVEIHREDETSDSIKQNSGTGFGLVQCITAEMVSKTQNKEKRDGICHT